MIHAIILRAVMYLIVIPIGGWMVASWASLPFIWFVIIDVVASTLFEVALRGPAVAAAVLVKSIVPSVLGALVLPRVVPAPTAAAAAFSVSLLALTTAGAVWFVVRARQSAARWRATVRSLHCLGLAVTIELAVAGAALHMARVDFTHVVAALAPAGLWWLAYRSQNPIGRPRRQVSLPYPLVLAEGTR